MGWEEKLFPGKKSDYSGNKNNFMGRDYKGITSGVSHGFCLSGGRL